MTRTRRLGRLVLALLALVATAACGDRAQPAGPLRGMSAGGRSEFAVAWIVVAPGEPADLTAYVVNTAADPVTLVSAALIGVPGHPAGRLAGLGVGVDGSGTVASRGWPPAGLTVTEFTGTPLPHGRSNIIFGFAGTYGGQDYMVSGLRIAYLYHGQAYSVVAYAAGVACVAMIPRMVTAQCRAAGQVVRTGTAALAGI